MVLAENDAIGDGLRAIGHPTPVKYANKVREHLGDDGLALLAIAAIRRYRGQQNAIHDKAREPDLFLPQEQRLRELPVPSQAYVIRQLKRPEEVQTLDRPPLSGPVAMLV